MIRRPGFWIAAAVVAVYAVRAVFGALAGPAFATGRGLARQGFYEDALPYLERADVGPERAAILWLRAEVREGLRRLLVADGESGPQVAELLADAHREYLEAIRMSPASGWYWVSLGRLYFDHDRELARAAGVSLDLFSNPWSQLGHDGRVGIGLTRLGIAREASVYSLRDELVDMLFEAELTDEALAAVRDAARVQPLFYAHGFSGMRPMPSPLLDAFAEASRESLVGTPFMPLSKHLSALARIEERRGNHEQSERDARESLTEPGSRLQRAEAWHLLGVALLEQGRLDEADEAFEEALDHRNLWVGTLRRQTRISEERGDDRQALSRVRRLRALEPRNLSHAMTFARIAMRLEEWTQAKQALDWARLIHPRAIQPQRQLVELHLHRGQLAEARRELEHLERDHGSAQAASLRRRVQLLQTGSN